MKHSAMIQALSAVKKRKRLAAQDLPVIKIEVPKVQDENIVSMFGTGESFLVSGVITVRDVERRVERACKTVRALPDREARFQRRGQPTSVAMDVVQEFMDAYSPENTVKVRFRPTPFDVSDMLTALGWCRALTKKEFRYLWWRSFDEVSFNTIAMRIGRSDETARARYRDALLKVWHVANTQQTKDTVR